LEWTSALDEKPFREKTNKASSVERSGCFKQSAVARDALPVPLHDSSHVRYPGFLAKTIEAKNSPKGVSFKIKTRTKWKVSKNTRLPNHPVQKKSKGSLVRTLSGGKSLSAKK
jgi:hypothetical protein